MRWVLLVVLLAGCTNAVLVDAVDFEPVHFRLEGEGRVSYRIIVEGGPETLCSWRQESTFEDTHADEAAGFRAVFKNDSLSFASWNGAGRFDRILVGEYDTTTSDQISAIAHSSGAGLNGTGRLEVWFSYGAPAWEHASSLSCERPPSAVHWYRMDGLLWDKNTLEGGPFVNRPLPGPTVPVVGVTAARDYGADLRVDGELVATFFARDAPGALTFTGPSPKAFDLGPGVHADLWTGPPGDYRLRWEATHVGERYSLVGSMMESVEAEPSAIAGFTREP